MRRSDRPASAIRRIQQEDEDEELARRVAVAEDELIARKLQQDYENGVAVDDFHRPRSARKSRNQESVSSDAYNEMEFPDPINFEQEFAKV